MQRVYEKKKAISNPYPHGQTASNRETSGYKLKKKEQSILSDGKIGHFTVLCLVTWPVDTSEAEGDLTLTQTSLLFLFKCQLASIRTTVRSVSKQGHLQPHCHSEARSLSRQL